MKLALPRPRKKVVVVASLLLTVSGALAGAAAYFGFLPIPFIGSSSSHPDSSAEKDGHIPESGNEHATNDKKDAAGVDAHSAATPEEASATAEHGEADKHGEVSGDHVSGQAAVVEVSYSIPARSQIVEAVKQLLEVQTDAAFGRKGKFGTQKDAIEKVQSLLLSFDSKKATQHEYESLAVYLLSGGNPRGLSDIIKDAPPKYRMGHLLLGVRAFVIGDIEKAKENLEHLDARSFPPALASRLLMAQAALMPSDRLKDQQRALELAASLAPGTLVEEAAYRRLLSAAAGASNAKQFSHFANRYIRRFPNSAYVSDFVTTFQDGILAFEEIKQPVSRKVLQRVAVGLSVESSSGLLVKLGLLSVNAGHTNLCNFVTGDEFGSIHEAGKIAKLMKLYSLACQVVAKPEEVLPQLESLAVDELNARDIDVKSDAVRLARALLGQNKLDEKAEVLGPALPDRSTAELMVSATQQLSDSQALIEEALK